MLDLRPKNMHPLSGHPIFELGQRFRTSSSKRLARDIIKAFYKTFDKDEARDSFWLAVSIVMRADNEQVDHLERSNCLLLFEHFEWLNEAIYYLSAERNKRKQR